MLLNQIEVESMLSFCDHYKEVQLPHTADIIPTTLVPFLSDTRQRHNSHERVHKHDALLPASSTAILCRRFLLSALLSFLTVICNSSVSPHRDGVFSKTKRRFEIELKLSPCQAPVIITRRSNSHTPPTSSQLYSCHYCPHMFDPHQGHNSHQRVHKSDCTAACLFHRHYLSSMPSFGYPAIHDHHRSGPPDVSTRLMLKKLWRELKLSIAQHSCDHYKGGPTPTHRRDQSRQLYSCQATIPTKEFTSVIAPLSASSIAIICR
ncbi:hypothetical protein TIFTF001_021000 [Ficus carica]|uniref:C2H2-type domain-containing protein n=1 Tax=Ficus carica TaxID=3494 RepID=A0AA88AH59_FICCA|nr:hypothetical protein TIFTF001_021000 [Ficus carica]